MNGFGDWLRQLKARMSAALRNFMAGRYGTDRLNMVILVAGVAACLIGSLIPNALTKVIFTAISYGLMIWAIWRTMSRNTYARYQENQKFSRFFDRLKDRQHRYYDCPKCRQNVRVPRGKGKIAITCPKCGERFIRKS